MPFNRRRKNLNNRKKKKGIFFLKTVIYTGDRKSPSIKMKSYLLADIPITKDGDSIDFICQWKKTPYLLIDHIKNGDLSFLLREKHVYEHLKRGERGRVGAIL